MRKEWLGEVEIKPGLFVEKGQDDYPEKCISPGKYAARLEKIPSLDDPSFTLSLYPLNHVVSLRDRVGIGDAGDAIIVTSSDLRGSKILLGNEEKKERLLKLGQSVEDALEIQPWERIEYEVKS